MECVTPLKSVLCTEYCFLTGNRPLRTHSYLCQHLCDTIASIIIIINHKSLQPFQLSDFLNAAAFGLQAQSQPDHKLRTLALFRMYLNGSTHHINDVLGNSHA